MLETSHAPSIQEQLGALLHDDLLKPDHKQLGDRLLDRLVSNTVVVLAGPLEEVKFHLYECLQQQRIPWAEIRLAEWGQEEFAKADLCIWCTEDFSEAERQKWEAVPDRLRDHSFLVSVFDTEVSETQAERLEEIADQVFYGLFPIEFDPVSGASERDLADLVSEVRRRVARGRAADEDNAQMFLSRHVTKHARETASIKAVATGPNKAAKEGTTLASAGAIFGGAMDSLKHHLVRLEAMIDADAQTAFDGILTICSEAAEEVTEVFAETDTRKHMPDGFVDDLQAATDRVMLLSLEGGVTPARMAVTTLLQVKREIEARMAT